MYSLKNVFPSKTLNRRQNWILLVYNFFAQCTMRRSDRQHKDIDGWLAAWLADWLACLLRPPFAYFLNQFANKDLLILSSWQVRLVDLLLLLMLPLLLAATWRLMFLAGENWDIARHGWKSCIELWVRVGGGSLGIGQSFQHEILIARFFGLCALGFALET